ncbi:hypothetical protein CC1G_00357 [Coprinopsis cinerea okayama7|uniref:Uncharacterized protein n=1 Tax=Coprinopsis cinerea (strain Okayama-7 / 130 / ATCC MYA-4618 / FGSC 9003) TaxID=240176 RepID=A8NXN7_COPC7|nr:hypothetical protein CC1G_00357 [Coprinopsis cinerea okayama7\|eukprot:XP_001837221.2 hypothetical protein CC1G_00357 [Coprinopsis cinerea okayama7\
MRRFVQAFGLKRDKHENPSASKGSLKSLALPFLPSSSPPTPVPLQSSLSHPVHSPTSSSFSTPHLSSASSDPSSHSSGSSSGSASLSIQTPDDDHSPPAPLARSQTKRSWKAWIGGRRSASLKHRDRKDKDTVDDHKLPDWDPLSLPVPPSLLHPTFQSSSLTDVTDDEMHISSVSDFDPSSRHRSAASATYPIPSPSPLAAKHNLRISIKNSLVTSTHGGPFIQPATGPIYPRSCNRSRLLTGRRQSLHSVMLKKRLLRRIDDHIQGLTPLEEASILPFGSKPTPVELVTPSVSEYNDCYPDKTASILSSCPGLRQWICRPCFEDRFVIYLAADGGEILCKPVSSSYAVAALEYSEVLDVMVDPDFELPSDKETISDPPSPPPEPISTIKDTPSVPSLQVVPNPSFNPRRHSHTTIPSPLRIEHSLSDPVMPSTGTSKQLDQPQQETAAKKLTVGVTPVKRVVRFVEDDDDDGVPLHLLRMKKKREERSKFLRQERQRRMREALEQQQRREAEAREAREREQKRLAKEKERKEREQRLYADQIAASRQRSEQARAGAYALSSSSSSSLLVSPLATSANPERNSPRTMPSSYSSPRREPSEFGVHGSSSGGSRPSSRPASTYSVSSEEARSPGSRRNSLTPSMNGSMRGMSHPYPTWSGSSQSLSSVPVMPQLAAFAAANNDMPLLPPTAPFMKQYSNRQSSPGPDSRRGASSSSERRQSSGSLNSLAQSHRNHSSTSLRRESANPASPTPSSPQRSDFRPSNHVRQGSGDSRNSKRSSTSQLRPKPAQSHSAPSVNRGRPAISSFHTNAYSPGSSPWTALPSRSGTIPTAMPVSPYSHSSNRSSTMGGFGPMGHDWRSTLIS